jgi:predicted nucleic acid-binding protein
MIVVADTSPLNYLVLLGRIEILAKIYGEVVVPQTVIDELQDSDAPSAVRAWFSTPPAWLQVCTLSFRQDPLMDRLDRGEQDAILLAESLKAERLIIDDLEGRREAARRRLPVIGTLGLLAEAARRNLLDLPQALAALQATNFHVSPELIEVLLKNDAKQRGVRSSGKVSRNFGE